MTITAVQRFLKSILVASSVLSLVWFYALLSAGTRNTWALPATVTAILTVNYLSIRRVTLDKPLLRQLLGTAYVYKTLVVAAFALVLLEYYGGGDALAYHDTAAELAAGVWRYGQFPEFGGQAGTYFVGRLTAYIYLVIGSSFIGGMLFYGSLSFWGSYFYLRMYRAAFPKRDLLPVALLLFFFPSITFWTSSISKDALILFFGGVFCWNFSRIAQRFSAARLPALGLSVLGMGMVRPHIALMAAIAATTALTMSQGLPRLSQKASRFIGLVILAVGIFYLLPVVVAQLRMEEFSLGGTQEFLEWQFRVTARGGSSAELSESLFVRFALAPLSLVRPFPWEAHNLTSAIASLEGMLFLYFLWRYRRNIFRNVSSSRNHAVVVFALAFLLQFFVAFASIANFGTLARQRVMLFPILFVLLTPPRRQEPHTSTTRTHAEPTARQAAVAHVAGPLQPEV